MRQVAIVVCVSVCVAWGMACRPPSPAGPEPECEALWVEPQPDANVILIVSDTMRRDHVGVYGGAARTPAFDRFARQNLYFDQAYAQAPWTKPSIATLFTSLYPSQHRLASHPELRSRLRRGAGDEVALGEVDVLADGFTTLAEVFQRAGYRTAAFVSNPWMARPFGFDQGFELFEDAFARWESPGGIVSRKGAAWLRDAPRGERFFLYLHYIDSHWPYGRLSDADLAGHLDELFQDTRPIDNGSKLYEQLIGHPQQGFSRDTLSRLRSMGVSRRFIEMAYAAGVEEFDRALDMFLTEFATHPAYEQTVILIVSDHGEALFERGYGSHGLGLYDDEIAVPFAARIPGLAPSQGRVACSAGLIDVMPSLCDYLSLECPEAMYGRSFLAAAGANARPGYLISEGVMFEPNNRSVRNRRYKLVSAPEYSLHDIGEDPSERHDLIESAEHRAIVEALRSVLETAVPEFVAPDAEFAPLDPELEERLRSLGYIH